MGVIDGIEAEARTIATDGPESDGTYCGVREPLRLWSGNRTETDVVRATSAAGL
jgi:hypothetical protein